MRHAVLKRIEIKKVFEKRKIFFEKEYKYEATEIGNVYDSRYWSWVRMIGDYNEKNEEERFSDKIRQARWLKNGQDTF